MKDFFRLHTYLAKGPDRRETARYLSRGVRFLVRIPKDYKNREERRSLIAATRRTSLPLSFSHSSGKR